MSIIALLLSFGLLLVAMTVHEFSHGWVANKLGDRTAQYSGRLTLNPLAHVDPVWTILIPLLLFISTKGQFVFGAAKPVPVNYASLKNPRRDLTLIAVSGPLANLLLAFFLSALIKLAPLNELSFFLASNLIVMNVVLGIFNLIPIPPLDGSKIMLGVLPRRLAVAYASTEQYSFIILIILLWSGVLGAVIWPVINYILLLFGVS